MQRSQFVSTVLANQPLCREHYKLVLGVATFPPTRPGQFVQVSCRQLDLDYSPEHEFDWQPGQPLDPCGRELMSPLAMLRRPFSLAGRRETKEGVELEIIHRVVGVGTDWLSRLGTGDTVHLLGPLGNHFELPEGDRPALLIGGGVGIPPMLYLAEALRGREAVAFAGALTRDLLPFTIDPSVPPPTADDVRPSLCITDFARHGVGSVITTDDGSFGFRGFVTQALEKYLDGLGFPIRQNAERGTQNAERPSAARSPIANRQSQIPAPVLYTCGPEPMMKRVADIAAARGLDCQIAVERAMACGMGTCQSCCIKVKKPDPNQPPLVGKDWSYRLACTDGPVFKATELLW